MGTRWGRLDVEELETAVAAGPVVALGPHCTHELLTSPAFYPCVDGSTRAEAILDVVARFASGTWAGACLLTVIAGTARQANAAQLERLCTGYLSRLSKRLERSGVPCNWDVLHDADPARSIASYVEDGVVALTSHGTSDRTGGLGPVARRVVRLSGSPVLLLSAPSPPPRPLPRRHRPDPSSQRSARSRSQPRVDRRWSPNPPVCPECGTDGPEGATFCGHCGHHLGATTGEADGRQHLELRP